MNVNNTLLGQEAVVINSINKHCVGYAISRGLYKNARSMVDRNPFLLVIKIKDDKNVDECITEKKKSIKACSDKIQDLKKLEAFQEYVDRKKSECINRIRIEK